MSSIYISELAINNFRNLLTTEYTSLEAPIYSNEPTWDVFLMYYSNKKDTKKGLFKFDVQIKGTDIGTSSSFDFELSDLENYMNNHGVILLVSKKVTSECSMNYMRCLLPEDIKSFIKGKENQKTISIPLKQVFTKEQCLSKIKVIAEKYKNLSNGGIPLDRLENFSCEVNSIKTIQNEIISDGILISNQEVPMYISFETTKGLFYLNNVILCKLNTNKKFKISIDNNVFFENASLYKEMDGIHITCNDALIIHLATNNEWHIAFDTKKNINQVIEAYRFLFSLPNNDVFYIGGSPIKLDNLHNMKEIESFSKHFVLFKNSTEN